MLFPREASSIVVCFFELFCRWVKKWQHKNKNKTTVDTTFLSRLSSSFRIHEAEGGEGGGDNFSGSDHNLASLCVCAHF